MTTVADGPSFFGSRLRRLAARVAGAGLLLDTNILLTATTPARRFHELALALLADSALYGLRLFVSAQVLREYLAVATRPADRNGLGLDPTDALFNVRGLTGRLQVLAEGEASFGRLARIVGARDCQGKQVHDAHIVATALAHDVGGVMTENLRDFRRFSDLLDVVDPAEIAAG